MESPAKEHRYNQHRRKLRKLFRANYERYVAEAKAQNIQRAAEKLVAEKLAADKAAAAQTANPEPSTTKKPPVPAASGETFAAKEDAIA